MTRVLAVAATLAACLPAGPAAAAPKPAPPNSPPTISGLPATSVVVSGSYSFTPVASDPDGDRVSFSIVNKPAWASFSRRTGRLAGTPTVTGTYGPILVSTSDGKATATLPAFSIVVAARATNTAPEIAGTPVTQATVNEPYAFRPAARDADGDPLTYSVQNPPYWATFDIASGLLYGTPTATGTHPGIVISVSDGRATTSLAAFSITVQAPVTRSATLRWTPPQYNVDGSPLTDLSGYRVAYGTSPGRYTTTLSLKGPSLDSVVIEGLASGTWYFAVQAVNSAGAVSDFSQEVSKSL